MVPYSANSPWWPSILHASRRTRRHRLRPPRIPCCPDYVENQSNPAGYYITILHFDFWSGSRPRPRACAHGHLAPRPPPPGPNPDQHDCDLLSTPYAAGGPGLDESLMAWDSYLVTSPTLHGPNLILGPEPARPGPEPARSGPARLASSPHLHTPLRLNAPRIHSKAHGSGSDFTSIHALVMAQSRPHTSLGPALCPTDSDNPRHTGLTHTRRTIDLCVPAPGWSITCGRNHPAIQGVGT